jgi:serine/threonine protein kinase
MPVSKDPRIGTEFVGYRIETLLRRGGMGVVYRADDLRLKRKVALKLLAPELAADDRFRERFLRESELAASLDHPHIVPIYSAGEVHRQLYIAMRFVEGTDLKQLLEREGPLEPRRALALVAQLADALDAAHARGLVHRDVKPSNALLDSAEHVYLSDFGLTKSASDRSAHTLTGRVIGTVDYAAPEQIRGEPVDGRADVYSLGCLLYECLTGEVPLPRDSELAALWAHVHEQPAKASERNRDLPPAIDRVVAAALAKEPGDRYSTCVDLVEAARDALGLRDVVVVRDRRPLLLIALGALVAAGAAAAVLALTLGGRNGRPRPDLTVRQNTLVRIDPATNRIASVTRVGSGPESVASSGNTVWVYNWTDRTVSEVDARTGSVRATTGIPGSSPHRPAQTLAADATGAWALSTSLSSDLVTHVRSGLVNEEFPLPGQPLTLAVGRDVVWVGMRTNRRSAVLEVDAKDGSVRRTTPLASDDVQSLSVGEGAVWAIDQGGTLFRLDPISGRVTDKRRLPISPGTVESVVAAYGAVWVLANQPAELLRIDPRTLEVTKTISAPEVRSTGTYGGGAANLAAGAGSVWWNGTDTGTMWRVDPHSGEIVSTTRITTPIDEQNPPSLLALFEPLSTAAGADGVWVSVSSPF